MRPCNLFRALTIAFASSVIAVPADVRIPTAINQAAADPAKGSTVINELPTLRGPEQRFRIANTDTVLYIAPGSPVQLVPLRILLSRMQLDLIFSIRQYQPEGIPHTTGVRAPRYHFQTRTPSGQDCYFYMNAYKDNRLTYAMVNETVAGLKTFMLELRHMTNVYFQVETGRTTRAVGALSIGLRESFLTNESAALSSGAEAEANTDISLKCTWGEDLSSEAIKEALDEARDKLRVVIYSEGRNGKLPGPAGEWSSQGREGGKAAKFSIVGKPPAHLTWGDMQDAVHELSDLSFNGVTGKEATCQVLLGTDEIGTLSITRA